ncbi:MAG: tripartite tricarboxylate transporter TctB family protein [Candidatus Heteroscillospira sp.]|jgi:putative tricarboxylic transport membrane protein
MKKYLTKDVIVPAVTLLFFIVYILEALKLSAPVVDGVPQETFFPVIIFIFGTAATIMLLVSGIKKVSAANYVAPEKKKINYKPFYIVLATAAFIFFFDILGYTIMAPLYLFTMMMIYDDKPQHIVKKIVYSVLITIFVYIIYNFVFGISFPEIWR